MLGLFAPLVEFMLQPASGPSAVVACPMLVMQARLPVMVMQAAPEMMTIHPSPDACTIQPEPCAFTLQAC